MATIKRLKVSNYRSIGDVVTVDFPANMPLVLLGENNAGKSNIVKALGLLLGQFWPGSHEPEDHEFHERTRENHIRIQLEFSQEDLFGNRYHAIEWSCDGDKKPAFHGYPGYGDKAYGYINNDHRSSCVAMVIDAERSLQYQLSYASKYTLMSRLMHRFHRAMLENQQVRARLEELFRKVKAEFNQVDSFADFSTSLDAQMAELLSSMTHGLRVSFEAYNPVNFFHALRLHAAEGDSPRTLDELGTGEQQVLALAFAYAYAKAFHGGLVLVVEEPESHLHPLAQRWLASRLQQMASAGLQVVVTTHCPHFVDVTALPGLVLVSKRNGMTRTRQMSASDLVQFCVAKGAPASKTTKENILPFLRAGVTAEILEGFFAKVVVLVEGPTEALALPVYLRKVGLDTDKDGVAIVPVHGKGNLAKWWRLFEAYGIPTYIVFDNDGKRDDKQGIKRKDALMAVGVANNEAELLIAAEDWIVEAQYCIFGADFERQMRESFVQYSDAEAESHAAGVDSKVFAARWVADRLERTSDVGWERFEKLAEAIRTLLAEGAGGPKSE